MAAEVMSASDRTAASYKRLAASADILTAASDEFSKSISVLDGALKLLNLGISAWEGISGTDDDGNGNYWSEDVGYAKVGGTWGIALRVRSGRHKGEEETHEEWLFNDGPRAMRIGAIDKIPDLLERLVKAADKTTKKVQEKTSQALELAAAILKTAEEIELQRKQRRH
jgi:hypothetical protein